MLIKPEESLLLIIDIQEKLVPTIYQHQRLIDNTRWLGEIAELLKVPMLISEQYPQGLGGTVSPIADFCDENNRMSKQAFACTADEECLERILSTNRSQIVIVGMEAHVCVLQTALGLLQQGKRVYVVADAISSRNPDDVTLAIERMRQNGVQIVSREMVAFEWMQRSGTEIFKTISKNYLR